MPGGQLDFNAPLMSVRRHALQGSKKEKESSTYEPSTSYRRQAGEQFPRNPGAVPFQKEHRNGPPRNNEECTATLRLPPGRVAPLNERAGLLPEPHGNPSSTAENRPHRRSSDGGSNHSDNSRPLTRELVSAPSTGRILQMRAHATGTSESQPEGGDTLSETGETLVQTDAFLSDCRVSECSGTDYEDQLVSHTDPHARDFIMRRFLPAAQAMATESANSSDRRFANVREGAIQDEEAGDVSLQAGGLPSRLGGHTRHLRSSFQTTRSSSKSQSPQSLSWRKTDDEESSNSEESWSDEEAFADGENKNHEDGRSAHMRRDLKGDAPAGGLQDAMHMAEGDSFGGSVFRAIGSRKQVESKGFLGLPRTSRLKHSSKAEGEVKQMDRLGARLANMLSKSNYGDPHHPGVRDRQEAEAHLVNHGRRPFPGPTDRMQDEALRSGGVADQNIEEVSQKGWPFVAGKSALKAPSINSSSPIEPPTTAAGQGKWRDKNSPMLPPLLPRSPSESWLSNAMPLARSGSLPIFSQKPLENALPVKATWEARALQSLEDLPHQGGSLGA